MTAMPHIWIHVKERIHMILLRFALIYVLWLTLRVAHTVLYAYRVRQPGLAYLSLHLFGPESNRNVSHLHIGT